MRWVFFICFFMTFADAKGQVVMGRLMDKESNEPISYIAIQINHGRTGCFPDNEGYFRIKISQGDTLKISGTGFPTYYINHISIGSDTVNLGELQILQAGFEGYVTYATKKGKMKCEYVDHSKEIFDKDLSVRCTNGSVKFKWMLMDKKNAYINFKDIQICE